MIVAPGDGTVPPLLQVARSIPVVFTLATDPVGLGFASSLQRPGGNVTGITSLGHELSAKHLQLLKEAFPKVTHLDLLHESNQAGIAAQVKEVMDAGALNGVRVSPIDWNGVARPGL